MGNLAKFSVQPRIEDKFRGGDDHGRVFELITQVSHIRLYKGFGVRNLS